MIKKWPLCLYIVCTVLSLSCRKDNPVADIDIQDSNSILSLEFASSNIRKLRSVQMSVGGVLVDLEIADEPQSLRQGLMYRDSLGANSGMLFVFPTDDLRPFWMKNTYIPLSIAFITADGVIIGIDTMEPLDSITKHQPLMSYRYAIEMNAGWFKKHGVKVGDKLIIPVK